MGMLAITLQDLRFRKRQFLIAIAGAALLFAMTLLMAGLAAGFSFEIDQTVSSLGGQAWMVAAGSSARVAALAPIPGTAEPAVAATPGVKVAQPVAIVPQAATVGSATRSLVLVGVIPGGFDGPGLVSGRAVRSTGQAVVDRRLGLTIGQHFSVAGRRFTVVGTVADKTLIGGVPDVFVPLGDAQAVAFGGRPLVSAFVLGGVPRSAPPGLQVLSPAQVESQSLAAMASARSSIENSRIFAWVVAAVIVAAMVYVSALERTRDFAVLKALGSSSVSLFFGLAVQAVVVSLVAAVVAAAIAHF
ncbi:MAG: ABC transporter permease, partial [Acidobacteriota bacterium]|nr:ABC transporter permease [Acidobacteriota bacterium]